MLTAGDAAAEILTGQGWPNLWLHDKEKARVFASRYIPGVIQTLDLEIERQRRVAIEFFGQPRAWAEVRLVAAALLRAPYMRLERHDLLVLMAELLW